MQGDSKISIITPSKNTGRFAQETIETILAQTYTHWEHIVVDGASTDGTLEIIKRYPHIRWVSEQDSGPDEAFRKGLAMSNGQYVMLSCISDGYLDSNWFKKCVDILDSRPEISLVWGLPQYMSEEGALGRIAYDHFFDEPPPQGEDFLYYWLKTHFHFPEGNFCVRKNVIDKCFPMIDPKKVGQINEFLSFNYRFNTQGYLAYFIPVVANYGRIHHDAGGQKQLVNGQSKLWGRRFVDDIEKYAQQVVQGKAIHRYRDGAGNFLPGEFDINKYKKLRINNSIYEKSWYRRVTNLVKTMAGEGLA